MKDIVNVVSSYLQESRETKDNTVGEMITTMGSIASEESVTSDDAIVVEDAVAVEDVAVHPDVSQKQISKTKVKRCFLTSGNKFIAKGFVPPIPCTDQETELNRAKKRNVNSLGRGQPRKKRNKNASSQLSQKPRKQKVRRNRASKMSRQLALLDTQQHTLELNGQHSQQHSEQNNQDDTHQTDGPQAESSQVEGTTESNKQGRKRNLGNMVGDVLNKSYKMVTLNIGTIDACLEQGLKNNYGLVDCNDAKDAIQTTIQNLVRLNTELIRNGIMATFNYINTVMTEHPSIVPGCADIKHRNDNFQYISEDKYGYFRTLVKGLYYNSISSKEPSVNSVLKTIDIFKSLPGFEKGMLQVVKEYPVSSHFLDQVGQTLENMVRVHIRAFVSELKKRIDVWNHEWGVSQEGLSFLESIDDDGRSSVHDAVTVFWVLNTKLPPSKRFAYLPMPAFKDNYCLISEKHFLENVLMQSNQKQEILA
ncbi:hypothetical protein BGZ76_005768, partial [Entomortierella beljakovae]